MTGCQIVQEMVFGVNQLVQGELPALLMKERQRDEIEELLKI